MDRKKLVATLKLLMPGLAKGELIEQFSCMNFDRNIVRSTDGRLFIRAVLDEDSGLQMSVPGRILVQVLDSLDSEQVFLQQENGGLQIASSGVRGKLLAPDIKAGVQVSNLVQEPQSNEWVPLPDGFIQALKLCKFSASRDQTLGPLTGVHVAGTAVYSCDRYRVSRANLLTPLGNPVTISTSLIQELEKHAGNVTHYCIREGVPGQILFSLYGGKVLLGGGLIAGEFPPVDQFFADAEATESIKLPVAPLVGCLRRHILIQQEKQEIDLETRFTFNPIGGISLYSQYEGAGEIEDVVDFAVPETLKGVTFYVNPTFFTEILSICDEMRYSANTLLFTGKISHLIKTRPKQ